MNPRTPTGLSGLEWLQLLAGAALLLGAIATWSPRLACGVAGALLLAELYSNRRIP